MDWASRLLQSKISFGFGEHSYFPADSANILKNRIFLHDVSSTGRTIEQHHPTLTLNGSYCFSNSRRVQYATLLITFHAVPSYLHKFHARHNFCLTHDELRYVRRSRNSPLLWAARPCASKFIQLETLVVIPGSLLLVRCQAKRNIKFPCFNSNATNMLGISPVA